jgi:hypothetical protein
MLCIQQMNQWENAIRLVNIHFRIQESSVALLQYEGKTVEVLKRR